MDQSVKPGESHRKGVRQIFKILLEQWFLISLGIVIAIAFQAQVPKAHQHTKQMVVMYLWCTLDTKVLLHNYSRWGIHIFVQTQCLLVTSAVVFAMISATATNKDFLEPGLLIGFIFFSCVVTTISSNVVMTRQAKGDKALIVVQTTIGDFISVFITPALVVMYTSIDTWYNSILPHKSGQFAEIYRRVLKQLGLSIYLPLICGQVVRCYFVDAREEIFIDWKLSKLGSVSLLVIAFASHAFDELPTSNQVFLVFVSIALWTLFFGIAILLSLIWLPKKEIVAICYCVPAKGPAIGVPLATTIFIGLEARLESQIQIPILIYQDLQLAFGAILVPIFRRRIEIHEDKDQESNTTEVDALRDVAVLEYIGK
ncbi:hypothetical protein M433DRAFT_141760 [Acidomyces richmondensis BFW]|nr:hypothetical protein M433DRAFT_141760 [Acidomyces richmondensis BFW]